MENFVFRIHAYRDKLCLFINFAFNLGFDDRDVTPSRILKHRTVHEAHIDTEIKRFSQPPLRTFIERRNVISHRIYYGKEGYFSFFPDKPGKNISPKKLTSNWRGKVKPEIENADKAILKIRDMNERLTKKVLAYFKLNR